MDRDVTGFPVPDIQTSTEALKDVMGSEEGKWMAEGLKRKMEELSERYQTMTPEERAKFEQKFAEKFQKSLDNLKRVVHEKVEKSSSFATGDTLTTRPAVYSQWPVVLLAIAVLVGVIGYVAYRLIKYVEKKEEPKMSRQERMKAQKAEKKLAKKTSPPSSPKPQSTSNGVAKKRSKAA